MKKYFLSLILFFSPLLVLASESFVVRIGNNYYSTFYDAYKNALPTDEIFLLTDLNLNETININKDIVINLNNHNISAPQMVFKVDGGSLTLNGNGKIYEKKPYYAPILVKGSKEQVNNYSIVKVNKDVTLEGWAGIFIDHNDKYANGINIEFDGKINALKDINGDKGSGIYVNGNIKKQTNYPVVKILENANINSSGTGYYQAGYAKLIINGGKISGIDSGISIKSGILEINNGTIEATGLDKTPTSPNGNGTNASGASIQIESNNEYEGNIEITINNGKIISKNANSFYEFTATNTTKTKVNNINILGGIFDSKKDNFKVSDSFKNNNTKFISGGKFTSNVSSYLKNGLILQSNGNYYDVISSTMNEVNGITNEKKTNSILIIITIIFIVITGSLIYYQNKIKK